MLPIRLTLHNFMPYRAPDPISFEGLHLAVLSGPNGAGKSALLDAITWALWGRARARTDQELITLGADEMAVDFDFEQEGRLYRVARRRSRKRRQGALSLFVHDAEAPGGYTDISGASIRDTQQRINSLLRLDFDTFVHSAFLQQGRADAFTVQPPAQRKQILADILGLDAWQGYAELAGQALREIDTALTNIAGRLQQIEEDIAREPALRHDLEGAAAAYAEADTALQAAEAEYDAIQDAPARLRAASDRLADLDRRLREYERDGQTLDAELERLTERIAGYEAIIARRDAIEDGFATLEAARQADQALSDRLISLQDAEQRRHALEQQIAAAHAALEAQASDHRGAIEELERLTTDSGEIDAELGAVEADIQALEELEAERDAAQTAVNGLNEEEAALRSANHVLRGEMNTIKGRMDTLSAAPADSAACPTCQQPLSPGQRAELIDGYKEEGTARGDLYRENLDRLDTLRAERQTHDARLQTLLRDLSGLNALRQREGELRARQEATRDADRRLTEARAALDSVAGALDAENYAGEARAQLAALNEEIDRLGYDRGAHSEAREQLTTYRSYEAQHQQLAIALDALPEAQTALEAAQNRQDRLRRVRAEDEQTRTEAQAEVERLRELVAEANRRFDETTRRRTDLQAAGERRARIEQALHALDSARQRQDTLRQRQADLLDRQGVYDQLREAFSKSGVPTMIIEAAIPELADEANALLARMTDGHMQISFATEREKVSGGTTDTLDIIITDDAGTRDYALYSGGEAFRINFAIRVALSKLLARRAGAHLRTLFLDEGFGTQDATGRERLVEAINAVAGDFDLILVITHIDDLRDAFPARLEVIPTGSGSRVQLMG